MKIADITHDSDISQFLSLSQLEELLSVINSGEISKLREKVVAPITTEIQSGGLDEYSVNIGGNPIYNEKAVVLARSLEASFNDLNRVYLALISAGKSHLLQEINTYIGKLNQKISELSEKGQSYQQKYLFAVHSEEKQKAEKYLLLKNETYDEKAVYDNKLEVAKTLLDQVINWSSSPQTQGVSVSEKDITQDIVEDIKPKTGLVEPGYDLLKKFEF